MPRQATKISLEGRRDWRVKDPEDVAERRLRKFTSSTAPVRSSRNKIKSASKRVVKDDQTSRIATETGESTAVDLENACTSARDDEIDRRAIAMALAHEENEKRRLRYARKLTVGKAKAALNETGGIITQAAEVLGCSRSALKSFMHRHPELDDFLEEVREEILDSAEGLIVKAIRSGDLDIAKWFLMRFGAKRGYANKQQLLDDKGEAVDLRAMIVNDRTTILRPDEPIPENPIL